MSVIPVWMDVDTGTDDAVALMVLDAMESLSVKGLSAVCGNSPLERTFYNTRAMNTILNRSYPVYAGADRPLVRPPYHAAEVHGANGLGDVDVPLPATDVVHEEKAWDALYKTALETDGKLELIATGPLTNIAIALMKYPDLPAHIHTLLIMGGAAKGGNVTPCGEFNIYADPEAAEIVFKSGIPIVMCGLDVTEKILLTPEDWERCAKTGTRKGIFLRDVMQKPFRFHQGYGRTGVQMHDACPVIYLVHPELFTAEEAGVVVETRGELTRGKTVTDLYSDKQFDFNNAMVVLDADTEAVKNIILKSILS